MSFYEDISNYYDDIFPLKETRTEFTLSILPGQNTDILDIGCATGELALCLAKKGHRVTAVDLDEKMIAWAQQKANAAPLQDPPLFMCLNMLRLRECFTPSSFQVVLCFGNTLPHLQGELEILNFIRQCRELLKPGGKLVLQMVNFEHMMQAGEMELPLIQTLHFSFQRAYEFDSPEYNGRVLFSSTLIFKDSNHSIENCVPLYPLAPGRLIRLLEESGFHISTSLANESGQPFRSHSPSLLVIAENKS